MRTIDRVAQSLIEGPHRLVSTDVFDTLVLRDHSTEVERLAEGCRAAARVLDVDPDPVIRLRWSFQEVAYRSVAAEGARGEASLTRICSSIAHVLGWAPGAASVLRRAEVDTDTEHLRPNNSFIDVLRRAGDSGKKVIAVSDTYYGTDDLSRIVRGVTGGDVVSAIYSSADVGLTKHTGGLFGEVARREGVSGEMTVHVGDNFFVDVGMARAASWHAVHMPRGHGHDLAKVAGKVRAVPVGWRRWW